jgi:hypothetical protein
MAKFSLSFESLENGRTPPNYIAACLVVALNVGRQRDDGGQNHLVNISYCKESLSFIIRCMKSIQHKTNSPSGKPALSLVFISRRQSASHCR